MFQFGSSQTSCTALLVPGDQAKREAGKGHYKKADVPPCSHRQRYVSCAPHPESGEQSANASLPPRIALHIFLYLTLLSHSPVCHLVLNQQPCFVDCFLC